MGISSLGVGSGILTQDLLDQLREADEAARITPLDYDIANEQDKINAYSVLDEYFTNFSDSVNELQKATLFDERSVEVSGSSVEVTASANSDIQEFTLDVTQLATKQIEESGSYGATTDTIASASGSLNLNIDGQDFTIDYTDTTTLDDLKQSINNVAGDKVNATIVQVGDGDYRLFLNSVDTGSNQDITITDNDGNLSGTQLTDDLSAVQTGVDAEFTFNGQAITRNSNDVSDLITGYDITLKEVGTSNVNVTQNRDEIMSRVDSFVEKYNSMMDEITTLTKSSTSSDERGIFSSESTLKGFQNDIRSMMDNLGGDAATIYDYGFDIDKDGKLTIDKDVLNTKLDEDPANVEAFFTGGDYKNSDGTTTAIDGAFVELFDKVDAYTRYNGIMDQFKDSMDDKLTAFEDQKQKIIEQLDDKYETMKKRFTAYDAMISQLNATSDMFTQLTADSQSQG